MTTYQKRSHRMLIVGAGLFWSATTVFGAHMPSHETTAAPSVSTNALPSGPDVLKAIDVMFATPFSLEAKTAGALVMNFAKDSPSVSVTVSPEVFEFTGSAYDAMLFAHYVAGAVQYDLQHPQQRDDPVADVEPGLRAAVHAYRKLQEAKVVYRNPFFERALMMEQRGTFATLVSDVIAARQRNASNRLVTPLGGQRAGDTLQPSSTSETSQ